MEQAANKSDKTGLIVGLLVLAGIAGFYFLNKKKTTSTVQNVDGSTTKTISNPASGQTVVTTTNTNGSSTTVTKGSDGSVVSTVVNVKNTDGTTTSTITDSAGNVQKVTNPAGTTPVTGVGYVFGVPGVALGIPTDLYNDYMANQAGYAAAGKPPPLQFDNTVPGQVTVIPYDDPTHPVTYADPTGALTFTNVGGTPVPNDPDAVIINSGSSSNAAAPVAQPQVVPSSNTGNNAEVAQATDTANAVSSAEATEAALNNYIYDV